MRAPEIKQDTFFGKDIIKYLNEFNIKSAIEIGSGSGNGSTQCFLEYFDKLNDNSKKFYCFEPVVEWFYDLQKNINNRFYCELYNCSAICYDDLLVKNFDDDFYLTKYNKLKNTYSKELMKKWYDQDILPFKNIKISILENIKAEAILIDGSEFSGFSEFKKLNSSINLIFLDDCFSAFKNNQTFEYLKESNEWKIVSSNLERNGYSIFRKKI